MRTPAHSPEAEAAVLAAILAEPSKLDDIADIVTPPDFYDRKHRLVYETMLSLAERGTTIDDVTLLAALRDRNIEDQVGGAVLVDHLQNQGADNGIGYAQIVRDKAWQRRITEAAASVAAAGYENHENISEFADRSGAAILQACESHTKGALVRLGDTLPLRIAELRHSLAGDPSAEDDAIATGLSDVDTILGGGLHRGDLVLLAARPGMGKTALGIKIAHKAAHDGRTAAVFSLEMNTKSLQLRILCGLAKIDLQAVRNGCLSSGELERLSQAALDCADLPLYVDDSSSLSVLELRSRARKLARANKLSLIVVDYLQILHTALGRSRNEEVGAFSAGLKALAKELNVPVLALSQLSRAVEGRSEAAPILADLRDSGSLEQDADVVLFIYDPQRGKANGPPARCISVAKQRNGPTDKVQVAWFPHQCRFENHSERAQ